ncbi:hypothetical protein RNJ44_03874 [Nakaseomyces bracarensis]|uniref:Uncharacterized protein n=1 Tax=Nakaseomyces bracarensis TaxID=273131 RepID=A0ABR4NY78_9SACH
MWIFDLIYTIVGVIIKILLFELLVQFAIWLILKIIKTPVRRFSFGILLGPAIRNTLIQLNGVSISIRTINLRASLDPTLVLSNIEITLPLDAGNQSVEQNNENTVKKPVVSFRLSKWQLLLFKILLRFKFYLNTIKVNINNGQHIKIDLLTGSIDHKKGGITEVEVFGHEITNENLYSMNHIVYLLTIKTSAIQEEGRSDSLIQIYEWNSYLKTSNTILNYELVNSTKNNEKSIESRKLDKTASVNDGPLIDDSIIHTFVDINKHLILRMRLIDLRIENINVIFSESKNLSISNLQLCLKSMNSNEKRTAWELVEFNSSIFEEYELSVSANTIVCQLSKTTSLRLPLVSFLITTDLLAHYTNKIPISKLKVVITINVINPSFFSTVDNLVHILKRAKFGTSKHESEEDQFTKEYILDQLNIKNFPSFTLEFSFSNFTSSIGLSDTEDLNLSLFSAQAIICHSKRPVLTDTSLEKTNKVQWSFIKNVSPNKEFANYMKMVGLSIAYLKLPETMDTRPISIPICGMERLDTFLEDLFSKKSKVQSTLRHFTITLDDIIVLEKLSTALGKLNSALYEKEKANIKNDKNLEYVSAKQPNVNVYTSIFNSLDWSYRLRCKDISFSLVVQQFLPSYQDPISPSDFNLTDISRGIKLLLNEFTFESNSEGKKLQVQSASIYRVVDTLHKHSKTESMLDIVNVELMSPNNFSDIYFDIPNIQIRFDVTTIWIIFFISAIWDRYNVKVMRSQTIKKPSKKKHPTNWNINLQMCDVYIILPSGLPLIFSIKYLSFRTLDMLLNLESFTIHCKSVFITKLPVLVNLLQITNLVFDVEKMFDEHIIDLKVVLLHIQPEYHMRLYIIIDDIITLFKSFKQIKLAFENILYFQRLYPSEMLARSLPKIRLKFENVLVGVEEDPFEQELGLIYKVGVFEQRERMRKVIEFDKQIDAFKKLSLAEKQNIMKNSTKSPYSSTMNEDEYIHQAKMRLYEHHSNSWIIRYRKAKLVYHHTPFHIEKKNFFGNEWYIYSKQKVITCADLVISNLNFNISPPSFPIEKFMDFIYDYGKGVPKDMQYTLLIIMGVDLYSDLFELRLRDYPIPVMSFSQVKTSGDIVFAEKMPTDASNRSIYVPFVNSVAAVPYNVFNSIYGTHILRTLNSIKLYYNLDSITSASLPSYLTWGKSLQPAFESLMLWFDYLTKPPLDPSEKLGFWDKFRYIVHGRWVFRFLEESAFHLNIKGSYDPYKIADDGAGLSFCWSKDVAVKVHDSKDPTEFLKINSNQFLLAIRDYTEVDKFDKVYMNLKGDVIWKMGLLFEQGDYQKIGMEERLPPNKPHYEINLVNPESVQDKSNHDSYAGFRTRYIHMSFGVYCFEQNANNNLYFSPNSIQLFLQWWNLFHQYTSGPIRQGPLFTDIVQNKNKFGTALFTIKYQLHLEPLSISHTFRHISNEYNNTDENQKVTFTGIKGRVKSLKIDLHQKRIKLAHIYKQLELTNSVWKFRMYAGEIDCIEADVRIISAIFDQDKIDELLIAESLTPITTNSKSKASLSCFMAKEDWFDSHDYYDVDYIPVGVVPSVFKALPLMYSPRISYFRKINEDGFPVPFPFGLEPSHTCIIGRNHPEFTQEQLALHRKQEVEARIKEILGLLNKFESHQGKNSSENKKISKLNKELHESKHRLHIIHNILNDLKRSEEITHIYTNDDLESSLDSRNESIFPGNDNIKLLRTNTVDSFVSMRRNSTVDAISTYDNRFMLHNIHLKIDKSITHHLLQYAHNWVERKSMRFFMTYKSVCIVQELLRASLEGMKSRFQEFGGLSDLFQIANAEFIQRFDEFNREVSNDNYEAIDSFLIRLISPQVQIRSDCEINDALILSARDIETGIIDINQVYGENGKQLPTDVDTIVETRYCVISKDLQLFTLFKDDLIKHGTSGFKSDGYGADDNTMFWPPWIPLEMCYDGALLEKHVVLRRRSMFMTFTQPNNLYFSQGNNDNSLSTCSNIRIAFPGVVLTSTSQQYCSVYAIIQDLLEYASSSDQKIVKLSKTLMEDEIRNSIEELNVSSIIELQDRVRNLLYIRAYMKLNEPLTYKELLPIINFETQTSIMRLTFLMTAIKQSYDKLGNNSDTSPQRLVWQISTEDLIWELFDKKNQPFVTIGLGPSKFLRIENSDGYDINVVSIKSLQCFNQQTNPVFTELFAPDKDHSHYDEEKPMVEISWVLGNPVGGISDVHDLIVSLQPSLFKMDHETGTHLMRYLFPDVSVSNDDGEDSASIISPRKSSSSSHSDSPAASYYGMSSTTTNRKDSGNWDIASSIIASSNNISKRVVSPFREMSNEYDKPEWNISEMVERSGEYFSVRNFQINQTFMSVSYKGTRKLFTDVNNLTVKIPTLLYQNKLWSRDELFTSLKKDIVKIVLHHLGSIIGNKFLPHKKENKKNIRQKYIDLIHSDVSLIPKLSKRTSSKSTVSIPFNGSNTNTTDDYDPLLMEGDLQPTRFFPTTNNEE